MLTQLTRHYVNDIVTIYTVLHCDETATAISSCEDTDDIVLFNGTIGAPAANGMCQALKPISEMKVCNLDTL